MCASGAEWWGGLDLASGAVERRLCSGRLRPRPCRSVVGRGGRLLSEERRRVGVSGRRLYGGGEGTGQSQERWLCHALNCVGAAFSNHLFLSPFAALPRAVQPFNLQATAATAVTQDISPLMGQLARQTKTKHSIRYYSRSEEGQLSAKQVHWRKHQLLPRAPGCRIKNGSTVHRSSKHSPCPCQKNANFSGRREKSGKSLVPTQRADAVSSV